MNLLIDSCSYNAQNVGDVAMLEVATSRLRELWPSASIGIITNAPDIITSQCGDVHTVPVRGRRLLLAHRLLGPLERALPEVVARRWHRIERRLRVQAPGLFVASLRLRERLVGRDSADVATFLAALAEADLLVVSGAGILTDAFTPNVLGVLATLEMAQRRGIPTAILGHGVGPIDDERLRRRVGDVLRNVDLITVRESHGSLPLLLSLGVNPNRIVVTGDDAIEMAYCAAAAARRPDDSRSGIGVNVRIASASEVGPESMGPLREVLHAASRAHEAALVPLPIARHRAAMDIDALDTLLPTIDGQRDAGAALDTPQKVIARVADCRLVVTGSYHAAVFALSQGIPVVCLVKSVYYRQKFRGLAQQFGTGCDVLELEETDLSARLLAAIDRAWWAADALRPVLLAAALNQIRRGRAAYARLPNLRAGASDRSVPEDRGGARLRVRWSAAHSPQSVPETRPAANRAPDVSIPQRQRGV